MERYQQREVVKFCKERGIHLQVSTNIYVSSNLSMQSIHISILWFRPIAALAKMLMDLCSLHRWLPRFSFNICNLLNLHLLSLQGALRGPSVCHIARFQHDITGCPEVRQESCPSVTQVKTFLTNSINLGSKRGNPAYLSKKSSQHHCHIIYIGHI